VLVSGAVLYQAFRLHLSYWESALIASVVWWGLHMVGGIAVKCSASNIAKLLTYLAANPDAAQVEKDRW
jgi:hypothetical protein